MSVLKAKRIKTFLWFDGQAEDAAKFYTSIFANGKIGAITRYPDGGVRDAGGDRGQAGYREAQGGCPMKITIETAVQAPLQRVWEAWNSPDEIRQWNAASPDWHTPRSSVDLREGGKFNARMEAKDGSIGFDFEGTYTRIVTGRLIEYRIGDGREVRVEFREEPGRVLVRETFDAETMNPPERQRQGWQAILDSFARHVQGGAS